MNRKLVWKKYKNPLKIPDDEDEDDEELSPWEKRERGQMVKAITGPFGVMPIDGPNSIDKSFKLYIGHTNFPLTIFCQNKIMNTYGVEAYNIISPYRFRIAVAQLYKSKEVCKEISKKLEIDGYVEKISTKEVIIENMKFLLTNQYKYWAICTSENKPMKVIGNNDLNVVKRVLANLSCDDVCKNF